MENFGLLLVVVIQLNTKEPHITFPPEIWFSLILWWHLAHTQTLFSPGRFPFTKKFRKFRLGCKWNMIFRFVPLENFRKKRNSWKGGTVFPVETSQWKFVFHLQISRLYDQFHAFRGLLSGQASLVFQQIWRPIRVSFLEAFCKQTFRAAASALPAKF